MSNILCFIIMISLDLHVQKIVHAYFIFLYSSTQLLAANVLLKLLPIVHYHCVSKKYSPSIILTVAQFE